MTRELKCLVIALVVLFTFATCAFGQQMLQKSLYQKALQLYATQRYNEVLPYTAELARISNIEMTGIEPRDEELLLKLAEKYEKRGHYELALTMYQAALDISEEIYGPGSGRVTGILVKIADLYSLQEKVDIAELVFVQALNIRTDVMGKSHPDVLLLRERISDLRERKNN